jgi:membrane protein YqaA with SNARE-associated domain
MLCAFATSDLLRDARHLGSAGVVGLGIIGAVIPLPGGVDALVVVVAAAHPEMWLEYTVMATIGTVAGGVLLYRIGLHGESARILARFPD